MTTDLKTVLETLKAAGAVCRVEVNDIDGTWRATLCDTKEPLVENAALASIDDVTAFFVTQGPLFFKGVQV